MRKSQNGRLLFCQLSQNVRTASNMGVNMAIRYFDIGANLAHESYRDDLPDVLARADVAGVRRIALTGSDLASSRFAANKALQQPARFVATAGIHPHHAATFDVAMEQQLRQLASLPQVRAIGETGMDCFRNFASIEEQSRCLQSQLTLATELGKPVFLHQRDAHEAMLPLVAQARPQLKDAVLHCFTGTSDELKDWLELDLYIGVTGWLCDERRGQSLRAAVPDVPVERLLVETDAPWLMPRDLPPPQLAALPHRHRNEPCTLPHTVLRLAECRQEGVEELAAQLWRNSLRFFDLEG